MLVLEKEAWNRNKELWIWIFNVGRGFSSFIKTPHNTGVIIDCGIGEKFKPFQDIIKPEFMDLISSDELSYKGQARKLAQVIVSHPHSDHCGEIKSIMQEGVPLLLTTPHSNEKERDKKQHVNWELVDNPKDTEDNVNYLKRKINIADPPLRPYTEDIKRVIPGYQLKIFFITPKDCEDRLPKDGYTNNLSIVTYISIGNNSILFTGDLMASGCKYLLEMNSEFRNLISNGISILVAPHHGLESAFCPEFFNLLPEKKVKYVNVISDKQKPASHDGKTHSSYQSSDFAVGYKGRYSFSTMNDGHIRIIMGAGNKLEIDTSHDIEELLRS
jgi:beta-lactamase superfamily II metal-dependent hydrolase